MEDPSLQQEGPYREEFCVALQLVRSAGDVIRGAISQAKVVSEKSSATDLVTETDQAVEKMLQSALLEKYPNYRFIGEESVAGGLPCELTDSPTWVIDPIDGTTNFIHSNPNICTILGFMVNKEVEFGIVYNPILNQLWTARRGLGAFYNGAQIRVSDCTDLSKALLIQEMGSHSVERTGKVLRNLETFVPRVRSIRTYGSAGINLAYLAMGAVDAYFEMGFHIWDYAAPSLIVREAGGVCRSVQGGEVDYLARNIAAAASPQLLDQIVPNIDVINSGRD